MLVPSASHKVGGSASGATPLCNGPRQEGQLFAASSFGSSAARSGVVRQVSAMKKTNRGADMLGSQKALDP
jgi:hypothetical protein